MSKKNRRNYFNLPQQLFDSIMDDLNPGQTVYINPDPNETEDHHYLTYTVLAQRKSDSEVYGEYMTDLANFGNFCSEVERRTGKNPDQKIIQAIIANLKEERAEEIRKRAAEYAKQTDIFGNPKVYKPRHYDGIDDSYDQKRLLEELKKIYVLEDDGTVTINTPNGEKKVGNKKPKKLSPFDLFDFAGTDEDEEDDFSELEDLNDEMDDDEDDFDPFDDDEDEDDDEDDEDEEEEDEEESETPTPIVVTPPTVPQKEEEEDDEDDDEEEEDDEDDDAPSDYSSIEDRDDSDEYEAWANWVRQHENHEDEIETPAILQVSTGESHHLADTVDDDSDFFLKADEPEEEEKLEPKKEAPVVVEAKKEMTPDEEEAHRRELRERIFASAMKSFDRGYSDDDNQHSKPVTVKEAKPEPVTIKEEPEEEETLITTVPEKKEPEKIPYTKPEVITAEQAKAAEEEAKKPEPVEDTEEAEDSDDSDDDDHYFYQFDIDSYLDDDVDNHVVMCDGVDVISVNTDYLNPTDPDYVTDGPSDIAARGALMGGLTEIKAWMAQTLIHFRPAVIMSVEEYNTMMDGVHEYDTDKFVFFKLGTQRVACYYIPEESFDNFISLIKYLIGNNIATSFFKKYTRLISDTEGFSFVTTSQNPGLIDAMVNSGRNKMAVVEFTEFFRIDDMTVSDEYMGEDEYIDTSVVYNFDNLETSSIFEDTFMDTVYDSIDGIIHYGLDEEDEEEIEELRKEMGFSEEEDKPEEKVEEPPVKEPDPEPVEEEVVTADMVKDAMQSNMQKKGIDLSNPKEVASASMEMFVTAIMKDGGFDEMREAGQKLQKLADIQQGVTTPIVRETPKPIEPDPDDEEEVEPDESDYFPNYRKEQKHASYTVRTKPKNKPSGDDSNRFVITRR